MRLAFCVAAGVAGLPHVARTQATDTLARQRDTLKTFTLPAVTVSVTRATRPMTKVPLAVQLVEKTEISRARPTWGLDEALATVPGVYAANRYNFSLDQRISIRGFGARSAFAVRGIKVLLDGIPQTLPDGQGQLTNLELAEADRIEVLRGSSSALFGNASGGVISIWTDAASPNGVVEELRVQGGTFDRHLDRTWTKWQSSTRFRIADGSALVTVSRLDYTGERQHSDADLRNLNVRLHQPLAPGWSLSVLAEAGDQPRADNPGALTAAEMAARRDAAAPFNVTRRAGKDVTQLQGGATLRRLFSEGGEATLTVFGLTRDLTNPTTPVYIALDRVAYGARLTATRRVAIGSLEPRLTAGLDFQRQRDDRLNFAYRTDTLYLPDTSRTLDQLERVTEVGPFLQSALDLTPRVTVTGGVRYDWVDFRAADRLVTGTNPDDSGRRLMRSASGSLGVTVAPSDAVTVYANVGTSFETPTTTELTNRPDTAGGFNPTLQPQKATNYEVGARGHVAGRLNYSVALYQVNVRDALIPFQIPSSPGRAFFVNAGRTRHRGLELGAHLAVVPGLSLITSWTVSHFRYTDFTVGTRRLDGRALPGIPKHWLNLLLQVRPRFARGAWAEVAETHSSGYFTSDTLDVRTAPWWTTSVRLGWDGEIGRVRVRPFVGFNNVFNRAYVSSVVINAAGGRYYEPAPGRNMYLGFSLGAGQ